MADYSSVDGTGELFTSPVPTQALRDEKLREDLEALRKEWGWFDVDFWHALAKIIRGET